MDIDEKELWESLENCNFDVPEIKLIMNCIESAKKPDSPMTTRRGVLVDDMRDGLCYVCGEKTDNYSANPWLWNIFLPHVDGQTKHRNYHMKCLYPIIKDSALAEENKRLREALEDIARGQLQSPYFADYCIATAKQALGGKTEGGVKP